MTTQSSVGRRERNKQAKLDRIMAAAGELFAEHGIEDVTTQQIAAAADIATGTLFLYAKSKSELLLLVQNAHYRTALDLGATRAATETDPVDAVMAILLPIIECNRQQAENGRAYLREIAFGDAAEPHHADAIAIVQDTESAVASALVRTSAVDADTAAVMARLVDGAMLLALAGADEASNAEIAAQVRAGVAVLLRAS